MTTQNKYREFWINERMERIYKNSDASCPDDEIHVIDIQALREAQAEIEKLKKRLAAFSHNHITRDIKDKGQCPACDQYHLKEENERYRKALGGFDD